jgi:hypothetical protein
MYQGKAPGYTRGEFAIISWQSDLETGSVGIKNTNPIITYLFMGFSSLA